MLLLLATFSAFIAAAVPAYAVIDVRTYDASIDFSLFTTENTKACTCTSTTDYLTITNTGSFSSIFYLTSDIQLSDTTFELGSGESRQVSIFIQADCNPRIKTYTINVKSNLGVEKTIEKQVNVERCQNLELWMTPVDEVSACENADYKIFVKNIGLFPEEYSLKSNLDKYMSYSSNYFTLLPEQTASINATLNLPCEFSGEKSVEFTARAVKNKLDATISSNLNVLSDYAFDVYINGKNVDDALYRQALDTCNRVWVTEFPVTVKNNGIDNTFTIMPDGLPKFASIVGIDDNNYKFSLARGESKTFYIIVDSHEFRKEYKGYDFSLTIKPQIGDALERNLRINLQPCYEHTITINDESTKEKPIEVCSEGFYDYDVEVKNNGIYAENIKLSIEGAPSGVDLSRYSVNVNPGESQTVKLYIQGPESNYLYDIKIVAELSNQLTESDDIWIQAHDKQTCHKVEFKKSNYNINYDNSYIEVPVKSAGLYPDYYDLSLNDTSLLSLEDDRIFINDSTKIRINVNSLDMPEGKYNVRLTAEHVSGADYSEDLVITLKDKSPIRKAFEYFFFGTQCRQISFWQVIAILLLCILIVVFMVVGPHYPYKLSNRIKQKLPILLALLVVFIIALVLVLVLADRPKTNNEVYGLNTSVQDLRFEILENEKYVLDASQFFTDPDQNSLSYEVSAMKDVKSTVKGNIITFNPDLGWYGTRTFTITAYDDQGGSIVSPEMTLKVLNVPRKSILELYNIYCWYTNLLIFLVILFLVFVAFLIKQQRRRRKK
jgi:hypothetical protein